MNVKKKILSGVLTAAMAASLLSGSALAVTKPTTTMEVDDAVPTTLSQRAASEIPQVFGLGVKAGTVFPGYLNLAGTTATDTPDAYAWNYNAGSTNENIAYTVLSDKLTNANGLYNSGGGNQVYAAYEFEEDGTPIPGPAVAREIDIIAGFSSITLDELDVVNAGKEKTDDDYYEPLIIDVQTGSVSSRLYSWAEMGAAIKDYASANGLTTRYGDTYAIGLNVEEFSAGIPYYIASLIANETITKKTAAYVSGYNTEGTEPIFMCVDPAGVGNVSADVFAEVNNFNFLEDSYTLEELLDEGVDVIILAGTGYSYNGGGTGSQPGGGNASTSADKDKILTDAADLIEGNEDYTMPLVMSSDNYSITIGNNGYNYSPITCMFLPYIQAYAYMDELATANSAINPMAMFRFMMEECFHVSSGMSESVALEYIGTKWTAVNEYDQVPSTTSYVYNKTAIEAAIVAGMEYALDEGENGAKENGNQLLRAYRVNDTAYTLLTGNYFSTTVPSSGNYITVKINGVDKYMDLDTPVSSGTTSSEGQFNSVALDFPAIVSYYHDRDYGDYGWNLQETLQYYADHMNAHVWKPVTGVAGTYGAGLSASASQD